MKLEELDRLPPLIRQVTAAYKLLARVPDDIILLAMGGKGFTMDDGATCLCGSLVRASLAHIQNVALEKVRMTTSNDTYELCAVFYGGSSEVWKTVFDAVTNTKRPAHCEPNHENCIHRGNMCDVQYDYTLDTERMILQDVEVAMMRRLDDILN